MNKKKLELFNERLSEIQSDALDRVVFLADDFGMDRDKAFFFMILGFQDVYREYTLKDYMPGNKEWITKN